MENFTYFNPTQIEFGIGKEHLIGHALTTHASADRPIASDGMTDSATSVHVTPAGTHTSTISAPQNTLREPSALMRPSGAAVRPAQRRNRHL